MDTIYQSVMERGFKLTTSPDYQEICAVCGETPVQPVEVIVAEYNLKKLSCRECLET